MLLHAATCFTLGKVEVGGSIPLRGTNWDPTMFISDQFPPTGPGLWLIGQVYTDLKITL